MIFEYFRKILAFPSKRLSPPEKVQYKAAENEFTSEGAPPPPNVVTPDGAADRQGKPPH